MTDANVHPGGTHLHDGNSILVGPDTLADRTRLTVGAGGMLVFDSAAAAPAPATVPEPGTVALLAIAGLSGVVLWRRHRRVK